MTRGAVPRVLSCELPVSCDLQLPEESATNTCRFDIGAAGQRPKVCNDRLDNTSHVHRIDVKFISKFNVRSNADRHDFDLNTETTVRQENNAIFSYDTLIFKIQLSLFLLQ